MLGLLAPASPSHPVSLLQTHIGPDPALTSADKWIMVLSKQHGQDLSPGGLDFCVYCKWKHVSQALNRNHRSHFPAFTGQALNKALYIYDLEKKKNQISQQLCEGGITVIPISYLRTLWLMNFTGSDGVEIQI